MDKTIWLREEISIAEELLSLAPKLTEEFLNYHEDFKESFSKGWPHFSSLFDPENFTNKYKAWKIEPIQYVYPQEDLHIRFWLPGAWGDIKPDEPVLERFPTAVALTQKYGDDCAISVYSIIEPNSFIARHTGPENRDNEFLRIHIPLIIPEGDIFFEVEGVEIDWSDIFGFDNQRIHSAYNNTPYRRLVYLIDIKRTTLGLPIAEKYNPERELEIPPFERGVLPKILHTKQKNNIGRG